MAGGTDGGRVERARARLMSAGRSGLRIPHTRRVLVPAGAAAAVVAVTAAIALGSAGGEPKRAAAQQRTGSSHSSALLPVGTLIAQGKLPAPTLSGDDGKVGVPPDTAPHPTTPVDLAAGRTAAQYAGRNGSLTPAGIATLAMQRGCRADQAVIATAVAMAESGGSPSAQGDVTLMDATWDWSAGLWQIRGLKAQRNTGALRDSVANQNAVTNSAAMYTISGSCSDWTPWSTYTNGAYRGYLDVATQAVRFVLAYYRAHHRYPAVAPPDPNATVPVPDAQAQLAAATPATSASRAAAARSHPSAHRSTPPAAARTSAQAGGSGGGSGSGNGNGNGNGNGGAGGTSAAAPTKAVPHPSSTKVDLPNPVKSVTKIVKSIVPTKLPTTLPPVCLPVVGC